MQGMFSMYDVTFHFYIETDLSGPEEKENTQQSVDFSEMME